MTNYTEFKRKCGEIESRFGGVRGLRLDNLNLEILKSKNLLNFGSGKNVNNYICENYYTLDNDPDLNADFLSLEDVPADLRFNSIIANQVFEHISKDEIFQVVKGISSVMKTNGKIIVTIPNVCNWFNYVSDFDHKNPLTFYHVGALFELNNIRVVDSYRWTKNPQDIINATDTDKYLLNFMRKYFEIDPAKFVCVVGEKI
jgi:hypothetical protein